MNFSYYTRHTSFALALFLVAFAQAQELTNNQTDISVARRLEWIRKGITHIGEQKESSDVSAKREDIRRLISVTGTENLLKQSLSGMIPQMKQAMPQVPDEAWREVEKPASIHEIIELYVSIYEKHFTHEDIKGMLDFYDSPLGKKTIEKMPIVMQEAMEAGNNWGIALAKRMDQKGPKQEQIKTASPPSVPTAAKLTPDQRAWALRQSGYDPEKYIMDDDGFISPLQQKSTTPAHAVTLPEGVQYIIRYNNASGDSMTYYSKEEPKPVGSGFKFKMWPTDVEFTLSGNVEIIKMPAGKKAK
jgi:hypothetical protein